MSWCNWWPFGKTAAQEVPESEKITGQPIRFQWKGKNYSADYSVFVQGRYVLLPDKKTVLRIRAWRLSDIVTPTDIVEIEDKRARKSAVPAKEEPDS